MNITVVHSKRFKNYSLMWEKMNFFTAKLDRKKLKVYTRLSDHLSQRWATERLVWAYVVVRDETPKQMASKAKVVVAFLAPNELDGELEELLEECKGRKIKRFVG
jgi:hypothetical protein